MGILNIMRANGIREGHRPVRSCQRMLPCCPRHATACTHATELDPAALLRANFAAPYANATL